ncbi:hypothetical protein KU6B_14070 [Mameliella alba]|nr:hypothetical protein KU6B_14070 [Mameliella alba]
MAEARIQRSLVARVLGAVLLILLLGGLLVTVSTWWNGRQAARQSYDRILLGAASDIAESIRIQNGAPFVDLPVSAFELLAQAPRTASIMPCAAPTAPSSPGWTRPRPLRPRIGPA